MFLENLTKLEKSLWNSHVEFMGVDNDMAEMYAQDRNDVIEVKDRFNRGHMGSLKSFIDRMDTHPRWITEGEGGYGFVEGMQALLKAQNFVQK